MRHYGIARKGDVIITRGTGNAPGAGGVISTVVITDEEADGHHSDKGGYKCRDATPAEIRAARDSGRIKTEYCS